MLSPTAAGVVFLLLLPLLLKLLCRLRLMPLVLYILIAGTVLSGWTEAHPILSMGIFVGIAALTVLSWLLPLFRHVLENRRLERDISRQIRFARDAGIQPEFRCVNGRCQLVIPEEE